jgi:hypothetical protein
MVIILFEEELSTLKGVRLDPEEEGVNFEWVTLFFFLIKSDLRNTEGRGRDAAWGDLRDFDQQSRPVNPKEWGLTLILQNSKLPILLRSSKFTLF